MLYVDFERYKFNYLEAQERVNEILDEKTILFQKTQPKSSVMDMERVSGGSPVNKTEEYVIEMELRHINERLAEAKSILADRKEMLRQKEEELRQSKVKDDVVYVCKWLDDMKASEIASMISYSEPQVYRIIKKIQKILNYDRK